MFSYQIRAAEMEAPDPHDMQQVLCRECGRNHRLSFIAKKEAWILRAEELVDDEGKAVNLPKE